MVSHIQVSRGSALCRRLGIAIVAFSPLGRGFLTGTITTQSQFGYAASVLISELC